MSLFTGIRFLVVDDMATMRKVISQQLRAIGVTQITEASDGALAKNILEQTSTMGQPIQFIVSDWNMPNMSGLELLQYCRSSPNYNAVAFLLVTAETEMTQVSHAIAAGVDNYVVKPFTPASLADKINAIYTKRFVKK